MNLTHSKIELFGGCDFTLDDDQQSRFCLYASPELRSKIIPLQRVVWGHIACTDFRILVSALDVELHLLVASLDDELEDVPLSF